MNQKQQELYEKLLKKVNEYCLGYAAEDVIAAIDALVENYEDQLDKRYVFIGSRMCGKSEELMRRANVVQKLEALEIIKKKDLLWDISYQPFKEDGDYRAWDNELYHHQYDPHHTLLGYHL